jgi:hypothetical protein
MASVKEMAIELEIRQDQAAALQDSAAAFRLGMLEACRLINEASGRITQPDAARTLAAIDALNGAWSDVFDGVCYLQEVSVI